MKRGLFRFVMPGLVPGIHVLGPRQLKTWMAGTSPAMTEKVTTDDLHNWQKSR